MGLTSQITLDGLTDQEVWSREIAEKLDNYGKSQEARALNQCSTTVSYCHCMGCLAVQTWLNHCDLFYCPKCAWRIHWQRQKALEWWSKEVPDPIHMVLTIRNRQTISKEWVKWFQACHRKLRRSNFASNWKGGLTSLEVTNESKGWHLHSHSLVDAHYIDGPTLARKWANLVQQDIAIVKCKRVTGPAYLKECTKYAVKGSDAARWEPQDIAAWIDAFTGIRTFATFGQLYKQKATRARFHAEFDPPGWTCPKCGSTSCRVLTQNEHDYQQATGHYP